MAGALLCASVAQAAPTLDGVVALPGAPFDGIAISPDGARLYVSLVASKNPDPPVNTIAVVDVVGDALDTVIDLGDQGANNSSPRQLYLSPDGALLLHSTYANDLLIIDTETDTVVETLAGLGHGAMAVWAPDSSEFWVRDPISETVNRVDAQSLTVTDSFDVPTPGSGTMPLVRTPDGARVYAVTSNNGGLGFNEPVAIHGFDADAITALGAYGVGTGSQGIAVTSAWVAPDGAYLYGSASVATSVSKVDLADDSVAGNLPVPLYGEGTDLSPDGALLYAYTNGYNAGQTIVFDAETLDQLAVIDTTGQVSRFLTTSHQSAFAPSGCVVILPAALQNKIFAIDPATHEIIDSYDTPGETAYVVEFDPSSARAYVTSRAAGGQVSGTLRILALDPECVQAVGGTPCAGDDECASELCVDGVCCDAPCGGGDPDDCQACSEAAGASQDGVCELIAGSVCRPGDPDSCDAEEVCDGQAPECPPDEAVPDDTPCPDGLCQGGVCTPDDATTSGGETSGGVATSGETTGGETSAGPGETTGTTGAAGSDSGTGGSTSSASGSSTGGDATAGPGDSDGDSDSTSGTDSDSAGAAEDGCGCRGGDAPGPAPLALTLAALALARRRRRAPRA
ncbi:MAG: hypothetical protein H6713_12465 [Myxococcales bacterium]|nr:hypothetical protein [Myxococcales bacterium]